MKIKLEMIESDIIRSIKCNKYSPMQLCASRYFKEDPLNIDINYDSITIWNDEINDYHSYKYCMEDIDIVKSFLDEWNDYIDDYTEEFVLESISFCVEEKN